MSEGNLQKYCQLCLLSFCFFVATLRKSNFEKTKHNQMLGREMILARNTTLSSLLILQKFSDLSENRINYPLFNSLINSPPEPGVVTSEGQSYRCTHRDAPIACESTYTQCNSCFCLCEAAATGMFGCAFFGRTSAEPNVRYPNGVEV